MNVGRSSSSPSAAAEFGDDIIHRQPRLVEQDAAGERVAVAVEAVAGETDHPVAGPHVAADDDPVERHQSDRRADQIEAAHDVAQLGDLAARNRDAGLPRPFGETDRDAVEHRRIGPLDSDVIDQRQRLRADAEQIVDIHRDAVDADRVVTARHLGDDRLRADPVGADAKPDPAANVDHVREIADRELHRPDPAGLPAMSR